MSVSLFVKPKAKLKHSAFLNSIPLSLKFEQKHNHYSRLFWQIDRLFFYFKGFESIEFFAYE